MSLQDEQAPIDQEIVETALSSTPEEWDSFTLRLEYVWADDPDDIGTVSISLHNGEEPCTPEDELYGSTRKLLKLFHRYGVAWISAQYNISMTDEGKWKYVADFQY